MLLEVSSGEGLDKLSILEIKVRRIRSQEKRDAVMKEITALAEINHLKEKYPFEYGFLTYVNEEIWDLTETLTTKSDTFPIVAARIFELNRKRFRIKRMLNISESSAIKEQKSTGETHCVIVLDADPYQKLAEVHSILFDYDTFSFDRPCHLRPSINFVDTPPVVYSTVNLSSIGPSADVRFAASFFTNARSDRRC
jgi:hypothetical protein